MACQAKKLTNANKRVTFAAYRTEQQLTNGRTVGHEVKFTTIKVLLRVTSRLLGSTGEVCLLELAVSFLY